MLSYTLGLFYNKTVLPKNGLPFIVFSYLYYLFATTIYTINLFWYNNNLLDFVGFKKDFSKYFSSRCLSLDSIAAYKQ